MLVGKTLAAGVVPSVCAPACAGEVTASARGTEPAGLSAISLTSSEVKTSVMAAERDCTRIVAGPWKCRKSCGASQFWSICTSHRDGKLTLSPQIVRLAQVRKVKLASLTNLQTALSRIVLQNLVSGSHVRGLGICNRMLLDLNR